MHHFISSMGWGISEVIGTYTFSGNSVSLTLRGDGNEKGWPTPSTITEIPNIKVQNSNKF